MAYKKVDVEALPKKVGVQKAFVLKVQASGEVGYFKVRSKNARS